MQCTVLHSQLEFWQRHPCEASQEQNTEEGMFNKYFTQTKKHPKV